MKGSISEVEKVEFYIDEQLKHTDYEEPYIWAWEKRSFFKHTITTIAYYDTEESVSDDVTVWKFF